MDVQRVDSSSCLYLGKKRSHLNFIEERSYADHEGRKKNSLKDGHCAQTGTEVKLCCVARTAGISYRSSSGRVQPVIRDKLSRRDRLPAPRCRPARGLC